MRVMTKESWRVLEGDCVEVMASLPAASVDAICTDPPYGLEFMGKAWDSLGDRRQPGDENYSTIDNPYGRGKVRFGYAKDAAQAGRAMQAWHEAWAVEALRVLKPGGHLLAFGGTRTYHRLVCGLEDAGFEIRDCVAWMYGSGFPKSLDVGKAIDKAAGAEREVIGQRVEHDITRPEGGGDERLMTSGGQRETRVIDVTAPATPEAAAWEGWGTALKPAHEPIVVARKPLVGTVAANVLAHGTGALNVDGCRIGTDERVQASASGGAPFGAGAYELGEGRQYSDSGGRWPANVVMDEEAAAMLDEQNDPFSGPGKPPPPVFGAGQGAIYGAPGSGEGLREAGRVDANGGASRFFYCAKAGGAERDAGLSDATTGRATPMAGRGQGGLKCRTCGRWKNSGSPCECAEPDFEQMPFAGREQRNPHPTVKPIALMRWLVRLVTPPGGVVLDPFAGSGTTGCAAVLEGMEFIGVERDAEYLPVARARVAFWAQQPAGVTVEQATQGERARRAVAEQGQEGLF